MIKFVLQNVYHITFVKVDKDGNQLTRARFGMCGANLVGQSNIAILPGKRCEKCLALANEEEIALAEEAARGHLW